MGAQKRRKELSGLRIQKVSGKLTGLYYPASTTQQHFLIPQLKSTVAIPFNEKMHRRTAERAGKGSRTVTRPGRIAGVKNVRLCGTGIGS
jgi:hypothetical protein